MGKRSRQDGIVHIDDAENLLIGNEGGAENGTSAEESQALAGGESLVGRDLVADQGMTALQDGVNDFLTEVDSKLLRCSAIEGVNAEVAVLDEDSQHSFR